MTSGKRCCCEMCDKQERARKPRCAPSPTPCVNCDASTNPGFRCFCPSHPADIVAAAAIRRIPSSSCSLALSQRIAGLAVACFLGDCLGVTVIVALFRQNCLAIADLALRRATKNATVHQHTSVCLTLRPPNIAAGSACRHRTRLAIILALVFLAACRVRCVS